MTKEERLKKRHRAEKRFRFYGLTSIFVALLFVVILVQNIFSKGSSAFKKTVITTEIFFDQELLEIQNGACLLYTSPSPRDRQKSRMPSSA